MCDILNTHLLSLAYLFLQANSPTHNLHNAPTTVFEVSTSAEIHCSKEPDGT